MLHIIDGIGGINTRQHRRHLFGGLSFLEQCFLQQLLAVLFALLGLRLGDVLQLHLYACFGRDISDACAHHTRPQNTQGFNRGGIYFTTLFFGGIDGKKTSTDDVLRLFGIQGFDKITRFYLQPAVNGQYRPIVDTTQGILAAGVVAVGSFAQIADGTRHG